MVFTGNMPTDTGPFVILIHTSNEILWSTSGLAVSVVASLRVKFPRSD